MTNNPDRDNLYTSDNSRSVYTRESNGTGWFVGIIVALALLAIGYLVFSANSGPSTGVGEGAAPTTTESPMTDPATPAPMTEAPATGTEPAPMTEAPATETAPAAPAAPATEAPAPATETPAPAEGGAAAPTEAPASP
ncbi:hypothetical protein [Devosia geojensis]|uniref:hypothetical protein n=1 Tax=Devosia geojensis TaxID=443610 RepID=UPI00069704E2|nr:hypothetical protein [Devosia geojensis]